MTPEDRENTKKLIVGGAVFGAVLTIVVSLLMDFLYSDALQGTWRDAIVMDMDRYFSVSLETNSLAVYAIFALVFFFLSLVGAFFGSVFMIVLNRFLRIFTS